MEQEPDCVLCYKQINTVVHCDRNGKNPMCTRCNEIQKIIEDFQLVFEPRWKMTYKSNINIELKR